MDSHSPTVLYVQEGGREKEVTKKLINWHSSANFNVSNLPSQYQCDRISKGYFKSFSLIVVSDRKEYASHLESQHALPVKKSSYFFHINTLILCRSRN